jgi:hypothetical protein
VINPDMNGKRIRFIYSSDMYTRLKRGDEGTIVLCDDVGTIHVRWDNGSSLGMIPGEDYWEFV